MADWSKNTQVELRTLLRALGQATEGSKAALVQRLTAFLSDGSEATGDERGSGPPSASEATELEAAGADRELSVWHDAVGRLDKATTFLVQAQATETQARTAAAQARGERAQQKAGRGRGNRGTRRPADAPHAIQRADLPAAAARRTW
jgi:uncharacterized Ntn-hydrolase superfamily protein